MYKNHIVLGLGFGDEGKGMVVQHLCHHSNSNTPIVIRFSGGHQVSHTVVLKDKKHILHNFGSGTLLGVPTYWSSYSTFSPLGFVRERIDLEEKGIQVPEFYIEPLTPVVTPYDILANQLNEENLKHGSCGVGYGTTVKRNEESGCRFFVHDLYHKDVVKQCLEAIRFYYDMKKDNEAEEVFFECVQEACKHILISDRNILEKFYFRIFEGSQGILLDQLHGFFPNVTRANTTSKNALEIINGFEEDYKGETTINYITRSYLTRHGNGYLPGEMELDYPYFLDEKFKEEESNVYNEYQGKLRYAKFDLDVLNYAISCDGMYSKDEQDLNIYLTCADQIKDEDYKKEVEKSIKYYNEVTKIPFHISYSNDGTKIEYNSLNIK